MNSTAALRAQIGISGTAWIGVERFERRRLFDSPAVGRTQPSVSQKTFGVTQNEHGASARHHARAKTGVRLGAASGAQSEARNGRPAAIEKASLVITVGLGASDVFHFLLIAGRDCATPERVSGLREAAGTIGLIRKVSEWREAADAVIAGLHAGEMMAPMAARLEVPGEVRRKLLEIVKGQRIGRKEERLPGSASETGIAANAHAQFMVFGKAVAEISRDAAVEKSIVHTLAVSVRVRAGSGIIQFAEQAAHSRAATGGGKATTFGEKIDLRNTGCAAMTDNLNYTGHGVGAVEGAFRTVDDFDLVDVVESEIGEVEVATGKIDGSTVDEHFGKGGAAAVNKDGGQTGDRSRAREADAGLRGQKVRKQDGLALLDNWGRRCRQWPRYGRAPSAACLP